MRFTERELRIIHTALTFTVQHMDGNKLDVNEVIEELFTIENVEALPSADEVDELRNKC